MINNQPNTTNTPNEHHHIRQQNTINILNQHIQTSLTPPPGDEYMPPLGLILRKFQHRFPTTPTWMPP